MRLKNAPENNMGLGKKDNGYGGWNPTYMEGVRPNRSAALTNQVAASDVLADLANDTKVPIIPLNLSYHGVNNLQVFVKSANAGSIVEIWCRTGGTWYRYAVSAAATAGNQIFAFTNVPALETKVLVTTYSGAVTDISVAFTS